MRDCYRIPALRDSTNLEHVKIQYFSSHPTLNIFGVIPAPNGPSLESTIMLASSHHMTVRTKERRHPNQKHDALYKNGSNRNNQKEYSRTIHKAIVVSLLVTIYSICELLFYTCLEVRKDPNPFSILYFVTMPSLSSEPQFL